MIGKITEAGRDFIKEHPYGGVSLVTSLALFALGSLGAVSLVQGGIFPYEVALGVTIGGFGAGAIAGAFFLATVCPRAEPFTGGFSKDEVVAESLVSKIIPLPESPHVIKKREGETALKSVVVDDRRILQCAGIDKVAGCGEVLSYLRGKNLCVVENPIGRQDPVEIRCNEQSLTSLCQFEQEIYLGTDRGCINCFNLSGEMKGNVLSLDAEINFLHADHHGIVCRHINGHITLFDQGTKAHKSEIDTTEYQIDRIFVNEEKVFLHTDSITRTFFIDRRSPSGQVMTLMSYDCKGLLGAVQDSVFAFYQGETITLWDYKAKKTLSTIEVGESISALAMQGRKLFVATTKKFITYTW